MACYEEEQSKCGLTKGDFVKVIRSAESFENGWGNSWVHPMNRHIGKVFEIQKVSDLDGMMLKGTCFSFPYFVLEKVRGE